MKRNKWVQRSGPYAVQSISQDGCGVRLVIYPAFPGYSDGWAIDRAKGEGGGPGIFTAIVLAEEMEKFLNQSYGQEAVEAWKAMVEAVQQIVRGKGQEVKE